MSANPYRYEPYSGLAAWIADRKPSHARAAAFGIAGNVACVGKLLLHCDTRELSPADLREIGDLLATLGDALNAVLNGLEA